MSAAPASRGGGRLLLLMFGLFALPFLIVGLLFAIDWRPQKPANHGELVADAGPLPAAALRDGDGRLLAGELLEGRWSLLIANSGPCRENCRAQLDAVRRIHVALNKQFPRVRRVLLTDAADDPELADLRQRYPDLVVATSNDPAWRALLPATGGPRLQVVDPGRRLVLRYPQPFDPRSALRDVERLLRYSWIG